MALMKRTSQFAALLLALTPLTAQAGIGAVGSPVEGSIDTSSQNYQSGYDGTYQGGYQGNPGAIPPGQMQMDNQSGTLSQQPYQGQQQPYQGQQQQQQYQQQQYQGQQQQQYQQQQPAQPAQQPIGQAAPNTAPLQTPQAILYMRFDQPHNYSADVLQAVEREQRSKPTAFYQVVSYIPNNPTTPQTQQTQDAAAANLAMVSRQIQNLGIPANRMQVDTEYTSVAPFQEIRIFAY
jgi:hypothetical protein